MSEDELLEAGKVLGYGKAVNDFWAELENKEITRDVVWDTYQKLMKKQGQDFSKIKLT